MHFVKLLDDIERAVVKQRRKHVSYRLFSKCAGVVRHGPFKGLRLDGEANVSKGLLALKVFGLYESVVMDAIISAGPFRQMVNIGAADGYFSLGVLRAGMAERAICFELTEAGRAAIQRNAERNGLADRVTILGVADDTLPGALATAGFSEPKRALVLCDIEGAEFEVLSETALATLAGAAFIVELHDRLLPDGAGERAALIQRLPSGYRHEILKAVPVNWSGIPELEALSDNDRALVTSEGRKALGEWLFARPA